MSQAQVEYDQEEAHGQEQVGQTSQLRRRDVSAIPPEMKYVYIVLTITALVVLGAVALTDSIWIFPFVYVPTVITYIAGALYSFKRLFDYRPPRR
jgi:hypothetical protein